MGINIGLDIGAISLKMAALGKPEDRPILSALCAAHPAFRLVDARRRPLVLSDYRRIAGSPIQSTYDLLQRILRDVPEDRVEGIRVTGSGSRTIAKILGLYFENEFKAIARMMRDFYPQVQTVFESAAKARSTSAWKTAASRITTAAASAPPAPDLSSTSRRCACSIRWKRWATWCATPGARRASPAAARSSPKAT